MPPSQQPNIPAHPVPTQLSSRIHFRIPLPPMQRNPPPNTPTIPNSANNPFTQKKSLATPTTSSSNPYPSHQSRHDTRSIATSPLPPVGSPQPTNIATANTIMKLAAKVFKHLSGAILHLLWNTPLWNHTIPKTFLKSKNATRHTPIHHTPLLFSNAEQK